MEDNEKINSRRELSVLWIKNNCYDALERVEEYERMMRTGFRDLTDYLRQIGITENQFVELKLKNQELMIVELGILISNVKKILNKEQYKKAKEMIQALESIFYTGTLLEKEIGFNYVIRRNDIDRKSKKELTNVFFILERELIKLRSKMVDNLSDILFSSSEQEEMI